MTPQQITLVNQTWVMVVPISDKAAELFYGRLFVLDPSVKPMFKGDMTEQGKKLMKTINIAVQALDNVEPLIPTLKEMGAAHAGYGVKDKDTTPWLLRCYGLWNRVWAMSLLTR